MKTVNDYAGLTDNDKIEAAIRERENGMVYLPPRRAGDGRDWWLLDRAILLPENTTFVLQNARIKLSDKCRDNFFRTVNCGLGIDEVEPIKNVHIRGEGFCVLEGADHPRATGDGSKILACPCPKTPQDICSMENSWVPAERRSPEKLGFWDQHDHTYGTDAGREGESQYGDWRDIGILFANASYCSVENLRMEDFHGWGISWEACSFGQIRNIDFDACMAKEIDGMLHNMENQDGIDLRNGCHDIVISDITGGTGDDLIALTAIAGSQYHPGGALCTTHVMHADWSRREKDIHDIIIRNVQGYSKGHICYHIRLLPARCRIYNVVIDGVIDTSPEGFRAGGVLLLGDGGDYGENFTDGMRFITVSNVICDSREAVIVGGYLRDSSITNIVNRNPDCPVIHVHHRDGMVNVAVSALTTVGKELIVCDDK